MPGRPPYPPFDAASAAQKVQAAENAWNTRDPEKVSLAYTEDSVWRNRDTFVTGTRGDRRVPDARSGSASWTTRCASRCGLRRNRIAVRFQYECRDADGQWWRCYGNENWEFAENGLMARREASINDLRIDEADRRILGPRAEGDTTDIPLA